MQNLKKYEGKTNVGEKQKKRKVNKKKRDKNKWENGKKKKNQNRKEKNTWGSYSTFHTRFRVFVNNWHCNSRGRPWLHLHSLNDACSIVWWPNIGLYNRVYIFMVALYFLVVQVINIPLVCGRLLLFFPFFSLFFFILMYFQIKNTLKYNLDTHK